MAGLDHFSGRMGANSDEYSPLGGLREESLEMDAVEQVRILRREMKRIMMGGPGFDKLRWSLVDPDARPEYLDRAGMERVAHDALQATALSEQKR